MINLETLEKLDLRNYLKELIISDLTIEELNTLINFLKQYPDENFVIDYIFHLSDNLNEYSYKNTKILINELKPISQKALEFCRNYVSGDLRFF